MGQIFVFLLPFVERSLVQAIEAGLAMDVDVNDATGGVDAKRGASATNASAQKQQALYALMAEQLRRDGHSDMAAQLSVLSGGDDGPATRETQGQGITGSASKLSLSEMYDSYEQSFYDSAITEQLGSKQVRGACARVYVCIQCAFSCSCPHPQSLDVYMCCVCVCVL
jgi:hypothetical protein